MRRCWAWKEEKKRRKKKKKKKEEKKKEKRKKSKKGEWALGLDFGFRFVFGLGFMV